MRRNRCIPNGTPLLHFGACLDPPAGAGEQAFDPSSGAVRAELVPGKPALERVAASRVTYRDTDGKSRSDTEEIAMNRLLILTATFALSLAGCSDRSSEPTEQASPDAGLVGPAATTGASDIAATPTPSPSLTEGMGQEIPTAMRGRFGLVPADCTSTRGDAKGLVTIGAREMRFYESVATLREVKPTAPAQLRGSFAYSGEGMEWSREVSLEARDGGKTLIMEEFGDDAPPGPRNYTRCG